MLGLNQPLLINILGHAAGALIFAIFLVLLFSRRGWSGVRGRYLSGLAAGLSLVWNAGSLVVLVWPDMPAADMRAVVAISFSVLSLLPAVLLHVSLDDSQPVLVGAGYVLSGSAVAMHFWEIQGSVAALHEVALLLITVGFLLLTATAVATIALRGAARGGARIAASMCLALFAMSFVHFGAGHGQGAWSSELFIHHAGIPLALFLLLQDYRFVMLDAFVRFLANALLAAVLTWLVIQAAFRLILVERVARDPLHEAELLISVCLFLVAFAWLRNRVQAWLTHALFRRGELEALPQRLKTSPLPVAGYSDRPDEEAYLAWAAGEIAAALRTPHFAVKPLEGPRPEWAEAAIPVRLGPGSGRQIFFGRRSGGRRYFGEDLDALGRAAAEIEEQVQAQRRQEMDRLVNQAELRALQSQINPHFLFNALNALYGSIPRSAEVARQLVIHLAEILRYSLESGRGFVSVAEEMAIVRAYLEVEKLRLGDRLQVEIEVEEAALGLQIPALSIQPLVENAIKHGISRRTEPGYVRIKAGRRGEELRISIANTAAESAAGGDPSSLGLGLENVRRRLEICCGRAAALDLQFDGAETRAELCLAATGGGQGPAAGSRG